MEAFGEGLISLCGKDAHKLLKGPKGPAEVEVKINLANINIRNKWTIMKRIEPIPTGHSLIIIPTYPLQCLNVLPANTALQLQELIGLDPKLL